MKLSNSSDNVTTVSLIYILKIDISLRANHRYVNRNERSIAKIMANHGNSHEFKQETTGVRGSFQLIISYKRTDAVYSEQIKSRCPARAAAERLHCGAAARLLPAGRRSSSGLFVRSARGNQRRFGALRWTQTDRRHQLTYTKLHHVRIIRPADHQGDKNDGDPC